MRPGRSLTICGQPCDGWDVDLPRQAGASREVACWACREVPTERNPKGGYRTRDRAYEITFDSNLDAWRDMAEQATGSIGCGRLPPRMRGVWLAYDGEVDEPIWFRGRRAFLSFKSLREELRIATWGTPAA